MANQPHHRDRRYVSDGRKLIALAKANPHAVCARCGKTIAEHPPHHTGKRAHWTRGHTINGSTTWTVWWDVTRRPPPGDWLAAEISTCNYSAGAESQQARHRTGYAWP